MLYIFQSRYQFSSLNDFFLMTLLVPLQQTAPVAWRDTKSTSRLMALNGNGMANRSHQPIRGFRFINETMLEIK